jgi:hypothetical protein
MKPRRRCPTWLIRAERIGAQSVADVGEGTGARSAADVAVLAGTAFSVELVPAAADCGVDFYGSWQDSWRPIERDACGRSGKFLANAFPMIQTGIALFVLPGRSSLAALDSVVAMAFIRACTTQGREFVRHARSAANVLP